MAATASLPSTSTPFSGRTQPLADTPSPASSLSAVPSNLSDEDIPTLLRHNSLLAPVDPIPFSLSRSDKALPVVTPSPGPKRTEFDSFATDPTDEYLPPTPSPREPKRRRIETQPTRSTRIFGKALGFAIDPTDALGLEDLPQRPETRRKSDVPDKYKKTREFEGQTQARWLSEIYSPRKATPATEPAAHIFSRVLHPTGQVAQKCRPFHLVASSFTGRIKRSASVEHDPPKDPGSSKPPPMCEPEVWADGRQALCETLPYYHAYQSGGYVTGGFAYGFMVDKESSPRDYMDSEVLISRAGGGLSRDANSGSMVRGSDQSLKSSQVQGVRSSMDSFNPVAIISGDRNPQAPCAMPHPYNVLDWFKPAYVWAEKSSGHVVIKYRFEKLDKNKQSWWMPQGLSEPAKLGSLPAPEVKTCDVCLESSTRIYLQGWMCLQPQCIKFWEIGGSEPDEASLLYDPRFLKQYTSWPHSSAPQPLRPEPMQLGSLPILGDDVSWAAGKGIACPDCGRCNSREAWKGWKCGNPACSFEYSLPHLSIPPSAIRNPYDPASRGYTSSKDQVLSSGISLKVEFTNNYRIHKYIIPGIPGFVAHFIANGTVNEERDGPDDMWTELQSTEIGLCRRPLQCSTLRGPMLTQHFSVNYGMPYKFIASTESRSFEDACKAIKDSRSRLNWAARQCVPGHGNEFNELLALGYFERQGIDYHDDGEKGLGPTIATLSLGSTSNMRIRMKSKHHNGATKSGAYVDLPPLIGCLKYEERKAAHDILEQLRAEGELDAAKYRVKQLPKELGLKSKGNAKDVLNMFLRHGDIVIMHGAAIQQYFEHTVEHSGKLRFALTCRYIDPESLPPADKPNYTVEADQGVYDGCMLPDAHA
ncbi:hypothetical protein IWZ03DRAFT_441940 [Phyllosticta citriasiana]|uniref:Alpha-ketoglutarate-dependent dioxygenase AlkB-like domain-containing protein n=1 Tax=Phyllosticta citriasiana TaxID=595635 RepID=A0ABR1KK70_9PEZI